MSQEIINAVETQEVEAQEVKTQNEVSVDAILTMLINGKSRAEISSHFGMPKAVLNRFFKHPKLAGHRPKKASGWVLVDGDEVLETPKPKSAPKKVAAETTEALVDEAGEAIAPSTLESLGI